MVDNPESFTTPRFDKPNGKLPAALAMHGQHAGLALTGDSDPGSPLEGIRTLERILSRFYAPYGKSGAFQNVIFPRTGHVYNDHTKQAMLEWFDRFLRG